jgi:F0F1-type ATP synthase assembly protein I
MSFIKNSLYHPINMEQEKKKSGISKFARFSGLGIQMGLIIALFTWLGTYLDGRFTSKTPWWTIGLSLFGVVAALYLVIKEVVKMGKEDE